MEAESVGPEGDQAATNSEAGRIVAVSRLRTLCLWTGRSRAKPPAVRALPAVLARDSRQRAVSRRSGKGGSTTCICGKRLTSFSMNYRDRITIEPGKRGGETLHPGTSHYGLRCAGVSGFRNVPSGDPRRLSLPREDFRQNRSAAEKDCRNGSPAGVSVSESIYRIGGRWRGNSGWRRNDGEWLTGLRPECGIRNLEGGIKAEE